MSGGGKVVCVTGASGYIASWLVKFLLERGYTVKASVRDPNDPKKTEHLRALSGANERLKLFKANLLEEGSFDSVVDGCEGVFHTASPCFFEAKDPQAELIDPALKGTLNVLGSCAKISSVRRVVLTSSLVAVTCNRKRQAPEVVVDETWFSDLEFCKELKFWYAISKTLSEQAALKFAKENGIDMVVINPSMVIGPLLQPMVNLSAGEILNLINGRNMDSSVLVELTLLFTLLKLCEGNTFSNETWGWVNVKDVANAHILAFEIPSASGRYFLAERVVHFSGLVKILRKLYPSLQFPEKCADDKPFLPTYKISIEKTKDLGIDLIPLEVSLRETIESLKEKSFISF